MSGIQGFHKWLGRHIVKINIFKRASLVSRVQGKPRRQGNFRASYHFSRKVSVFFCFWKPHCLELWGGSGGGGAVTASLQNASSLAWGNSSKVAATGSSWGLSEVLHSPMTKSPPKLSVGKAGSEHLLGGIIVLSPAWPWKVDTWLQWCLCYHLGQAFWFAIVTGHLCHSTSALPSPQPEERSLGSGTQNRQDPLGEDTRGLRRGQGGKTIDAGESGCPRVPSSSVTPPQLSPLPAVGAHGTVHFFLFSGCSYLSHDYNLISPNSELFSFQIYQGPGNIQRLEKPFQIPKG